MSLTILQSESRRNPRLTWEGCSVLLDVNDGDRLVFARLSPASTLKIGNKSFSLKPLIGCPFGSLFQIENGGNGPELARVMPSREEEGISCQETEEMKEEQVTKDELRDNRAIVDNNKAQSLSSEDIDAMRSQGATGDEIVEALIANSATFDKKTVFSQEKYRLKKQKKYAPRVLLRRPFTRSICEAYFKKYPARIGFLRLDALSLLLSFGNVTANSDVLVVDMVGGLLTGAVAERLGGKGSVCNTYVGNTPNPMDIVRIFNFDDEICSRIMRSSLADLTSSQIEPTKPNGENEDSEQASQPVSMDESPLPSTDQSSDLNSESIVSPLTKVFKCAKAGDKAPPEVINLWKENGFTSLIIAAPQSDAWSLVKDLLPLVANSAPFAIYHQYVQPLATCMHKLQLEKMAISLQISEPWLREYQVLPSRTHPFMQMNAFGGYILSGTKICDRQ
ncbi:tRNA (adenine(58)-N(1))-methyltransferase non-catalytic subunit trm6 isoform X2 [Cucumis sativus]|uniref:tRNA (adenine(58)-N(1))-methyltransferase non-catalytic subunit trm6 isoform X2 n=1 Tax=Cucumis sativus TaxID=3659 RepID=UPI0002B4BE16|nr:tRNA (adenine(58)-N(1))-methyltransferase non-catalytic subunit trm6 isoform X2 [Cucumis sativus]